MHGNEYMELEEQSVRSNKLITGFLPEANTEVKTAKEESSIDNGGTEQSQT